MVCFMLMSCGLTSQQKAERMVKNYLDTTLDDPKKYESVKFGNLIFLKDTVIDLEGKPDTIKLAGLCEIEHTYRGSNKFGAIIMKTDIFQLDLKNNKVWCCFAGFHNH